MCTFTILQVSLLFHPAPVYVSMQYSDYVIGPPAHCSFHMSGCQWSIFEWTNVNWTVLDILLNTQVWQYNTYLMLLWFPECLQFPFYTRTKDALAPWCVMFSWRSIHSISSLFDWRETNWSWLQPLCPFKFQTFKTALQTLLQLCPQ